MRYWRSEKGERGHLGQRVVLRTDSYDAQRGVEQLLYEYAKEWANDNGWKLLNKIRPINPSNPNADRYRSAGRKALDDDGIENSDPLDWNPNEPFWEYDLPEALAIGFGDGE